MRLLLRILVLTGLVWGILVLFNLARASDANDDPSRLVVCYAGVVVLGAIAAAVVTLSVLPAVGDVLGGWLFNANQRLDNHPHAPALARLAAGDYLGAIDEFRAILAENPMDMHAAREIVRIYLENLDDRESAVDFLQDAIQTGHWTDIQRGLLSERLKEITGMS